MGTFTQMVGSICGGCIVCLRQQPVICDGGNRQAWAFNTGNSEEAHDGIGSE